MRRVKGDLRNDRRGAVSINTIIYVIGLVVVIGFALNLLGVY